MEPKWWWQKHVESSSTTTRSYLRPPVRPKINPLSKLGVVGTSKRQVLADKMHAVVYTLSPTQHMPGYDTAGNNLLIRAELDREAGLGK